MTVVTSWLSRGLVTFELPPGSGEYEQEQRIIATAPHQKQVNAFIILFPSKPDVWPCHDSCAMPREHFRERIIAGLREVFSH